MDPDIEREIERAELARERVELAERLTRALRDTRWEADLLAESGAASLGRWPDWMPALTMRITAAHRTRPAHDRELFPSIHDFLEEHGVPAERGATAGERLPMPGSRRWLAATTGIRLLPALSPPRRLRWPVAPLDSLDALAERLELSDGQLAWLADVRSLERTVSRERLRNYRYRALPRDSGLPRVIESPKARLKQIQRFLLHDILDHVPPHSAAHGFTRGRSAVTHAEQHTGRVAVLRLDLKDFFASVPAGRVYRIWRTIGYAPALAHVLTGLTTNTVPLTVWAQLVEGAPPHAVQARFWLGRQLATPHLPQGAPTSPALANLAALGLDRRLAGLARASGLTYSRYADDLTFSGPARLIRRRVAFEASAAAIVRAEGFTLNPAKTTTQSAGGRQTVCGVVVNAHPNLRREQYDRLRATLHNAARHGPASQNHAGHPNFRAHLLGRISWVESLNPARAQKLHTLFAQIDWS